MYVKRDYRNFISNNGLTNFRVSVKETDLYIGVNSASFNPELPKKVEKLILALRFDLENYIADDPTFRTTLKPHMLLPGAPEIALLMARAANMAGVGPMAAVAGAFAECIGRELVKDCEDVIVENGGDIFIASHTTRRVQIFAGESPFSNRLALEIAPEKMPLGVCTSSGTVGPSLSLGRADAALVVSRSPALADAAASAAGNAVQRKEDVQKGIEAVMTIPEIMGALVIKDDQMAIWGDIKVVPVV